MRWLPSRAAAARRGPRRTWEAYTYNPVATVAAVRGMSRIIDETERATDGALKMKLHLGGSLQINATNITQAVADTHPIRR